LNEQNPVNWFDVWKDKPRHSILKWIFAVVISILLNSVYIMGFPLQPTPPPETNNDAAKQTEEEFLIDLAEEEETPQYVETNPEKVENLPDDTNNISNRDQQAAQENVAGPDENPVPFLEGEDPESMKLLEGAMPQEGAPSQPRIEIQSSSQSQSQQSQQKERPLPPQPESPEVVREGAQTESPASLPLDRFVQELPSIPAPPPTPDFIDPIEESDDPEGTKLTIIEDYDQRPEPLVDESSEEKILNINIPPSVAEQLAIAVEAQKALEATQVRPEEQSQVEQPVENQRPSPQPRPRLNPTTLPGPVMDSQYYAAHMDVLGYSAKFSEFGHYLQRMFEAIQLQWYSLLNDVTIGQENRPAVAIIRFTLNSEGRVIETEVIDTNAGNLATLLCQDAIESRSPFGYWTEQMVDQLGDQQDIVVRFIYL
jgi:hypothetical protein